jgi:putative endonuclease
MNRKHTGDDAETQACDFLIRQGLRLLERNFHCRGGEIDLIMQHGDSLVFIEVRYRKHSRYGTPLESITTHKQARVIHSARVYLQAKRAWNGPLRFDVVGIDGDTDRVEWITDAFQASA